MNLVEEITKIKKETLEHYKNSISRPRYVEDINAIREMAKNAQQIKEPSDTDYVLIRKLAEVYHPEHRGIVTGKEKQLIVDMLEIQVRSVRELRNLRNTVVMCGVFKDDFDCVSAITCVIDEALFKKGAEI